MKIIQIESFQINLKFIEIQIDPKWAINQIYVNIMLSIQKGLYLSNFIDTLLYVYNF